MQGRAQAPGAATVLNALATGVGAAFAIDLATTATVELTASPGISGRIDDRPGEEATLIELCVEETLDRYGNDEFAGGTVVTTSEIPMAAGLKSSSAAANATVLATLDALDRVDDVDRVDATRVGVTAARRAGVTVTGAFDDAAASMLGGVVVTDNNADELLSHEPFDRSVIVHTPSTRAYSADADVERCRQVAPLAELVAELAGDGRYGVAMTVNGLAFTAALGFSSDRLLAALPHAEGVSLSGTGPSAVAIGSETSLDTVAEHWAGEPGTIRETTTDNRGAFLG